MMVRYTFILSILFLIFTPAALTQDVNGSLLDLNGTRILRVWGTHAEMGYAHGSLLGKDIMDIVHNYIFTLINPQEYEDVALPVYRLWMQLPDRYITEIGQIYQGMVDANIDIFITDLNRDLTAEDIEVVNCIVDLWGFIDLLRPIFIEQKIPFACSSVCGWGNATLDDALVPGGTIHCRDMDWGDNSEYTLGKSSLIIAYRPIESDEQDWFSITFPGFIGCLSGMNLHGTGATLNMGNYDVNPYITTNQNPICIQARESLELEDPNNDGHHNALDVVDILSNQTRVPSTIIHAFGPAYPPDALSPPSIVIESNYDGLSTRIPADDPLLAPDVIAATNHHRVLYSPVYCWRYETIQTMFMETGKLDSERAWDIETAVSWAGTLQTMLFRPDAMDVLSTSSKNATPAPYYTPSHLIWTEIFGDDTPIPTSTPSPTMTPTLSTPTSQPGTATPTPAFTCTPTPDTENYTYDLQINTTYFRPGNPFLLERDFNNPGSPLECRECVVLDVFGSYWFWPDWDSVFQAPFVTLPSHQSHRIILRFTWPQTNSTPVHGLFFHGAILRSDGTALISNADSVQFSYGD